MYVPSGSYLFLAGAGQDFEVQAGSSTSPGPAYTSQLGYSYSLPVGLSYNTIAAQTYLHSSASAAFTPLDMEVWLLLPYNNGQLF
jgi:hypothetical protein